MAATWKSWFERIRPRSYGRKAPLILLNGLAEQAESWYRNVRYWDRYFDILTPNLIAYEGDALHRRIKEGLPITVDYLVEKLHTYLDQYVQTPPYHIVSSSLGGKVAVEFAHKYPELVSRLILICPSGMGDEERLPIMEGVKHNDHKKLIASVFHRPRKVDRELLRYYQSRFQSRRWKMGMLKVVKGTNDHLVRSKLPNLKMLTLFISGQNDRIVDPMVGMNAAAELPEGHYLSIPNCGHAPQIEKSWLINRLVVHFLTSPRPSSHPRFTQLILHKPSRVVT
ncbi:MAG: alpha/beta hydrolase [Planctomycetes bacterium]|nr:alpha/beta hydrolase [Planctomycetota bacterium]